MMQNTVFVEKAVDIAKNYKTTYIWGGIGLPITAETIKRAEQSYSKNTTAGYAAAAKKLSGDPKAFYFDCIGLIKAVLWGWCGDNSKTYGGARYASNGVPDLGADDTIAQCSEVCSYIWRDIVPGEAVWCKGHIGIYIGDGLAVECTPAWKNGVQITAVGNIGKKDGYNTRTWTKHGKLPWVDYSEKQEDTSMTEKEIRHIVREEVEKIQEELAAEPASPWAQAFWDKATVKGIVDGSRPRSALTRQEFATVLSKMIPEK